MFLDELGEAFDPAGLEPEDVVGEPEVLDAVVAQAKAWDAPALTVSWMPGPGSPEPFYLGYGFHPTGTNDHGEIDARLDL